MYVISVWRWSPAVDGNRVGVIIMLILSVQPNAYGFTHFQSSADFKRVDELLTCRFIVGAPCNALMFEGAYFILTLINYVVHVRLTFEEPTHQRFPTTPNVLLRLLTQWT